MSYVDRNSSKGRTLVTSGSVALLQIGLTLAVIKGFTVAFVEPSKPTNMPSTFYPTAPRPTEPPKPEPTIDQKPTIQRPQVDRTTTPLPVPDSNPTQVLPAEPAGPIDIGDPGDFTFVPPVQPTEPPARFVPKTARPRGDVAQWVTTNDYPTADIRAGHTGTVRFQLALDERGRVADCTIIQSSGFPGLDNATCRKVTERARFEPATDAAGERVSGSFTGTIRWVIPRD